MGVNSGVRASVQQYPDNRRRASHRQSSSAACTNLCTKCLQGKGRRSLCNVLHQETTPEDLLSPVPAVVWGPLKPHSGSGGPIVAGEDASAPISPGAIDVGVVRGVKSAASSPPVEKTYFSSGGPIVTGQDASAPIGSRATDTGVDRGVKSAASSAPAIGKGLVNPNSDGGGLFLDADEDSAPVVRGAADSDETSDCSGDSGESVSSPAPPTLLTKVSHFPFVLEGSNCISGGNCRYDHSLWSGGENFNLVAASMEASLKAEGITVPAGSVGAQDTSTLIVPTRVDAAADSNESIASSAPPTPLTEKVRACSIFLSGSDCMFGDNCRYLHSFSTGADDFHLMVALEGCQKPIVGIALPSGTNKLFVCSIDTVKILDCRSAQCIWMENICDMAKIGSRRYGFSSLIGVEAWVFFSFPGVLKAWNFQTGVHLSLQISGGRNRVYAIAFGEVNGDEFLFAGLQEGSILVWKWSGMHKLFEAAVCATCSLAGAHRLAIRSLVLRGERLYSGSMDSTIKVWDLANLHNPHFLAKLNCLQTLTAHNDAITSILFWNQFLLSGSLDGTVRVWATMTAIDSSKMELIYTHKEEDHVVALSLMNDAKCSPVLMCSCNDFTVYLYDLPSFAERGRIFSRTEMTQMIAGPEGLFFTGNMSGELKVWKWRTDS